ncbi:MAG: hypothetical protein HYX45_06515 [Burkholderiales bacterium]|nr:hypothetical protein [Burkholderiales bacterium]
MHDADYSQLGKRLRETMDVYQDQSEGFKKARVHPYVSSRPGGASFVDFKRHPERIAEVLEDFVVFGHEAAIQTFYQFLAWINGPDSLLESCDCALRGPGPHDSKYSEHLLCVHGRLMVMHRDLSANCDDRFNLLYNTLGRELSFIDQELNRSQGTVGFAGSRALYKDLIPVHQRKDGNIVSRFGDPGRGHQVLLLFKAFGDDQNEAFKNLDRVFKNIEMACRRASEKLQATKMVPTEREGV